MRKISTRPAAALSLKDTKLLKMILEARKLHRGDGERRRLVTNEPHDNSLTE